MNYLINWATKDVQKSIGHFKQHTGSIQNLVAAIGATGITVKQSWHVLGQNRGVLIVAADNLAVLHTAAVKLGEVFNVDIQQVLTDKEALAALAPTVK
jgi:ABC-type transporter Mla subunit MlaD